MLGVPIMALVIPPMQAAGIMLPVLMAMDGVGIAAYRRSFDLASLKLLVPAANIGVALGWATAAWVTADHVRLIVGLIAVLFAASYLFGKGVRKPAAGHKIKGRFWGTVAGFTSFVSHAGGPPLQVYLAPLRLDPQIFVGTTVMFFAVINAAKLVPYYFLGQLDFTNVATSAVLLPLAPASMLLGVWAVKRINPPVFYRVLYWLVLLVGAKLIWDGGRAILAGFAA
jgi:uncharacterized membrane protein YfcA